MVIATFNLYVYVYIFFFYVCISAVKYFTVAMLACRLLSNDNRRLVGFYETALNDRARLA